MTDDKILALIQNALFEVAPTRKEAFAKITLETRIDALQLDSIATMEMVGYVEDHLETTFEEDQLARVATVGDLAKIIRTHAPA
jgi:acyl carrier protein